MGTILDAEMPEQVIWPDQADCGGLAWTRAFSWKSDGRLFTCPSRPRAMPGCARLSPVRCRIRPYWIKAGAARGAR